MKYSIKQICQIVEGRFLQFQRNDTIGSLLTDSRRLIFPDTTLFFALKGPRRGGLLFLDDLYKRGCRNFIIYQEIPLGRYSDANIIAVPDALTALQQLTAYHRSQFDIPVIGITGSNGKTIVKEWLNQLLEDEYSIVRSPKSYNSQTGVPLSVWQMNGSHELAIFEAGISLPGEMRRLEQIIRPGIGIFTNIGEAHSEGFSDIREKTLEKLELFDRANVLIYGSDAGEPAATLKDWAVSLGNRRTERGDIPLRLFSWGHSEQATLLIRSTKKQDRMTTLTAGYRRKDSSDRLDFFFTVPFTDDASIENGIICVCVLLYLEHTVEMIQHKVLGLLPIAMRLELKSGINHCSIINDSYSADLNSLKIALDFLAQQQQHASRTVILSDILQSGRSGADLYREIAGVLQQKKIQRLIGIGEQIGAHRELFEQAGIPRLVFFSSVQEFKTDFLQLHFNNETILLKGARIFEFEEIDRLLSEQVHQTVLEIDLNAMAGNLKQYQQLLRPSTKMMAMVKAFAYGSGSFEIANLLQFLRVDYLAVAYTDEGVVLRKAGITMPIMVMNAEDNTLDALTQYHLEPVIYSFRLLHLFERHLKKEGLSQFPVHIELETGMNRLGFPPEETERLAVALQNPSFKVQSVFSHLAASEEAQHDDFTTRQAAAYLQAAALIRGSLPYSILQHIANSAAIIRHPELQLDMVRLGIGLYGIDSADTHTLDLQEVSALKSTIAQIKHLHSGDTVSYNRKGVAGPGTIIATVRIGYADGYPRSLGNGIGKMWVKGHLAPIIGSICMDMTMIDITGIPDVQEGDEVVVFGRELSVRLLAHWAGTIPYEILTGVSQRVKRVYFEQ
ncbi:MAG: bifunctional UDP-N-acetylmuramoyl-tripeptide:D-alanyl-D-alanine ligase/alanine racemase [Puia sp.]|nr:bifunctional UDP-N-acetylmuramoyl-tripeptide:D-alanyl-D-alanine ligase/alanine racemase [Puia sp.]